MLTLRTLLITALLIAIPATALCIEKADAEQLAARSKELEACRAILTAQQHAIIKFMPNSGNWTIGDWTTEEHDAYYTPREEFEKSQEKISVAFVIASKKYQTLLNDRFDKRCPAVPTTELPARKETPAEVHAWQATVDRHKESFDQQNNFVQTLFAAVATLFSNQQIKAVKELMEENQTTYAQCNKKIDTCSQEAREKHKQLITTLFNQIEGNILIYKSRANPEPTA